MVTNQGFHNFPFQFLRIRMWNLETAAPIYPLGQEKVHFFFGFGQENFELLLPNKKSVTVEGTKKEREASQPSPPPPPPPPPLPSPEREANDNAKQTHPLLTYIDRESE